MISKTFRLNISNTLLFLCDIQERFRPLITNYPTVINKSSLMVEVSKVMKIPIIVSEQYPSALGPTVPELLSTFPTDTNDCFLYSKKKFSMMTPELETKLETYSQRQVLLCGIESHVCVSQTALDLIDKGYEVHIICDAVSSQRLYDRQIALERLKAVGAIITTSEAAIFDLMKTAEFEQFKDISKIVKIKNSDPSLNQF